MTSRRWWGVLWCLGALALVLGPLREPLLGARRFVLRDHATADWCTGGFVPNGVYPLTNAGALPGGVATAGSWENGDTWQGEAQTAWMPVTGRLLRTCIAGYPQHAGCGLWAEFRRADGSLTRVACPIQDPHETWSPWDFQPPAGAVSLRLVAEDHASDRAGWLAFSEPFASPSQLFGASYMAAQVFTTLALALGLIWGPGLLWAPRGATDGATRTLWLLGTGPLLLAALGVLVWLLDGVVRPQILGGAFVSAWWLALGASLLRRPPELSPATRRALTLGALVACAAVAKGTYAGGPEGELFGGTISRTLATGDRSDARISFHVIQAAARHLAPSSAETERYFTPWTFFSRGPLAGLAAFPIVLATGGSPPVEWPDHSWTPFDPTGFAAYRIVLMALASMVIFACFAALVPLTGERWALIAAGLVALCPFGVHEVMFTWPKWEATAGVLAAFLLAHARRPFGAGLALAVGFLCHPMAALWAPWLALWSAGRAEGNLRSRLWAGAAFAAGGGFVMLPWMALGQLPAHLKGSIHAGQGGFIEYFKLSEYAPATWHSWWESRVKDFNNTFLPFWLHGFHEDSSGIGSAYGPIGPVTKFAFGWWATLPLGLGLLTWLLAVVTLVREARRYPAALALFVAGPALLLTAYWGAATTGLLRECGHPLLVAFVGVWCVMLVTRPGRIGRFVSHPIFPWLQLPETLLMLWLTTCLNPRLPAGDFTLLSPLYFAINLAALAGAAWILSRARREKDPAGAAERA